MSSCDFRDGASQVDLEKGNGRKTYVATVRDEIKNSRCTDLVPSENACICRVPNRLRSIDPEAYTPKLVSIGPLHHGKKDLLHMEEVKKQVLYTIIMADENRLDIFFDIVYGHLDKAREAYSEISEFSDDEFAKMLVFDGLLIISLFIWSRLSSMDPYYFSLLYENSWTDLMLFENQIPFFILEALFKEAKSMYPNVKLKDLNLVSLALRFHNIKTLAKIKDEKGVKHLLHLKHIALNQDDEENQFQGIHCSKLIWLGLKKEIAKIYRTFLAIIYLVFCCNSYNLCFKTNRRRDMFKTNSASELVADGLQIKRRITSGSKDRSLNLDVTFENGILKIPRMLLTSSTSDELKNLLAFELCDRDILSHFTSYVNFMNKLIKTDDDVVILRRMQILRSEHLNDAEVAKMFSGLHKHLLDDNKNTHLDKLYQNVVEFCEVPHRRWKANLKHRYCSSPWKIISVIAAFLLLFFTAIQTYFLAFYKK